MEIISLFTLKKVHLQNLKLIFPVILQIFDLECHVQTSAKDELIMFRLVIMKVRKLRRLYRGKKISISIKLRHFYCLSNSLF